MEINSNGDGLGIVINCKPIIAHGWMSFALWYSINKNIPDATVAVYMERGNPSDFMVWCWKMKVPFSQNSKKFKCLEKKQKIIELDPNVMAIKSFNLEKTGPSLIKNNEFTTFVDYSEGCGTFILSKWIDKCGKPPFEKAVKRYGKQATVTEKKVLMLWDKCRSLYALI